MYGPKLILFPPERPLGQTGGLFLAKSHRWHIVRLASPHEVCGRSLMWSGSLVLSSSCSTFCSENSSRSCLLGRRIPVFAVCHWLSCSIVSRVLSESIFLLTSGDCSSCQSSEYTTSNLPVKDWYGSSSHIFEHPLNKCLNTKTWIKHPTFDLPE